MTNIRSRLTIGVLMGMACLGSGCDLLGQPDSAAVGPMTGPGRAMLSSRQDHGDVRPVDSRERGLVDQQDWRREILALRAELDGLTRHVRALEGAIAGLRATAGPGELDVLDPDEPPELVETQALDALSLELADMEAQFRQRPADPETSRQATGLIEDAIYGMESGNVFFIEGLSCRSRECRLDVVLDEGGDPSVLDRLSDQVTAASGWDASAAFSLGTDATGARRMVLFLSHTGS